MAIDTAAKRRSVAGVLGYFTGGPGVTPDATPGLEWRQQAGYGYSGIAAGEAAGDDYFDGLTTRMSLTGVGHLWWLWVHYG